MESPFCTVRDATKRTGLSRNAVYDLIASGEVKTAVFGRRRVLDFQSLCDAINKRLVAAPIHTELSATMAELRRGAGKA